MNDRTAIASEQLAALVIAAASGGFPCTHDQLTDEAIALADMLLAKLEATAPAQANIESATDTTTQWIRYRFHADPVDPRPVKFPPPGPCWTTGYGEGYATVVAYLPLGVDPSEFWPEASNIESEKVEAIAFSSRFPCPEWWGG